MNLQVGIVPGTELIYLAARVKRQVAELPNYRLMPPFAVPE